ncbi:hypothetical protein RDABS01_002234 [Bienertia sinuspersici]
MPIIMPPKLRRGIGRPLRNKRREEDEKEKGKRSSTIQCKNCKEFGHNTRTCKGGLTKKQKKAQADGSNVKAIKKRKTLNSLLEPAQEPVLTQPSQ